MLKLTDRVVNVFHMDMDGTACSIILSNVFDNIRFSPVSFGKIAEHLHAFKRSNNDWYDRIFLTDVYDLSAMKDLKKLVFIDHHESSLSMHDPESMRFVNTGMCAAALTKEFCEAAFDKDLSFLNEFISTVNDYDMWILKNPKSKDLNLLHHFYGVDGFRGRFIKGDMSFTDGELAYIKKKHSEYNVIWNELNIMDMNHIKGCLAVCDNFEFMNELCNDLMMKMGYKIVFYLNPSAKKISARHCVNGVNLGGILEEIGVGGGHAKACGIQYTGDHIEVLKMLEKFLASECPQFI